MATKKSGNKWRIDKCPLCGDAHVGYSGKLDSDGIEYVVCGVMHKRMNVKSAQPWRIDDGLSKEDGFNKD